MAQLPPDSGVRNQPSAAPSRDPGDTGFPLMETGPYHPTPPSGFLDDRPTQPQDEPITPTARRPASGTFGPYELIEEVRRGKASLEEVFLTLMEDAR